MAAKLAEQFFKVLLEEAQKDERVVGNDEPILLRAVLITEEKKRVAWTLRVQGGRLESVSETKEDAIAIQDDSLTNIPTVQTDERTINELLAKTVTPLRAFMRGSIRITGNRDAWRILAEPARRAAPKVAPLLEKGLPWPTFAQIEFIQRGSQQWLPNLPKCQVCGSAFGTFFSRPHHCRVCGRVVCSDCSPHSLAGHRACEACYLQHAVEHAAAKVPGNGVNGHRTTPSTKRMIEGPASNGILHPHEKGQGPTILSRALDTIKKGESSSPIECAQTESRTEKLLRNTAISSLQETRSLKKQLEEIKSSRFFLRSLVRHAMLVGVFVLCWRASGTYSLAWYFLLGFSSYWRHSLVGLGVTQALAFPLPVSPLVNLSQVATLAPISLGFALTLGFAQAGVHFAFQRLFRIYSTSFAIIGIYQTCRVVCDRFLKLSEKAKASVFDRVDEFVAPMACEEVLELKSVFVKFGQYLGARSDVVPVKWSVILAKLQDDMPFDSVTHVAQLLAQEGFNLEEDFDAFDMNPVASASIAQVHKATYKGEPVAVKIQHERVEEMMKSDMKAFKRIMNVIIYLNSRFELAAQLLAAWETEMLKELDFTTEATNLTRVQVACSSLPDVVVPGLVKATKRTLVMKWVDGFKITDVMLLDLYGVDREALLKRCVQAYSHQIFLDGFFQADPHAGNLMLQPPSVDEHAKLVLLDFGMCVTLPDNIRLGYCKLLVALAHLSVSELSQAIVQAGYENSQSNLSPERDLEFFLFLLRDTGTREEARKESKEFQKLRRKQRKDDETKLAAKDEDEKQVPTEGRYFKAMPDSLLFLMRTLGLLRGLCTTLGTPTSYLENMVDYAKMAVILDSIKRLDEATEEKKRMNKLKRLAQTELERKIAKSVFDEVQGLDGGYQICVIQESKVIVDLCGGTLSDCDAKQVLPETLFPLCDLSKALCSLAALYAIEEGKINANQAILGPQNVGATLREALSHQATGMQDAISSSSFGHQLRENYDRWLLKVAKEASQTSLKTSQSEFHTQSYGYEIDLALRNSTAGVELVEQVRRKVIGKLLERELRFGGLSAEGELDDDFAKVSHGYAETIRMAMAAGGGSGGSSPMNGENRGLPSLAALGALPGRVVPDAAMVNDINTRKANLPSFGAYGTAHGLCLAVNEAMRRIPLKFWEEQVGEVLGTESNALFGRIEWGLGFAVHRSPGKKLLMLSHHSFGGSYLLFVPEKKLCVTVLVSHLTIERELTKNVLRTCCEYFDLPQLPFA